MREPAGDVPDVAGVRDDVVDALLTFVRTLRRAGVDVPANAPLVAARALVEVGFDDEDRARAALRAALVTRAEDIDAFDRMFAEFWRRLDAHLDGDGAGGLADDRPDGALAPLGADDPADGATADEEGTADSDGDGGNDAAVSIMTSALGHGPGTADEDATTATYSPAGRPERVTVDAAPVAEDGTLDAAVDRLVDALATLRGRRWQPASTGRQADARRALRRSVATGGAVASVPERDRRASALRALVLADVSRSVLDTVDRGFLLRFLRAVAARLRRSRVFFFDSEVREVSAAFDAPTTADALRELERAETAWGGGTRIGHAVDTVRRDHPTAVDRRTVVVVVSDGIETGDQSALTDGLAWVSRRAPAVLWLNPLAASPAYEPTVAGMAAALPFVDGLFAFTGVADVTEIARQLEQYGPGGRIGFEHDPRRVRGSTDATRSPDS
ncbi:VWA domain-containing protein [Halostella salina]|uniref:VWA domain-containing protein n=1 Tax=Halostella salina TaxID=1547897 RepID=UPI000EF7F195|nr:VWA domain-containing protein [Halostella salina]